MAGAVNLKHFSVVLLEEPSDWHFAYLSVRHAQIVSCVVFAVEADVVVVAPFLETTAQILSIPLCVVVLR